MKCHKHTHTLSPSISVYACIGDGTRMSTVQDMCPLSIELCFPIGLRNVFEREKEEKYTQREMNHKDTQTKAKDATLHRFQLSSDSIFHIEANQPTIGINANSISIFNPILNTFGVIFILSVDVFCCTFTSTSRKRASKSVCVCCLVNFLSLSLQLSSSIFRSLLCLYASRIFFAHSLGFTL